MDGDEQCVLHVPWLFIYQVQKHETQNSDGLLTLTPTHSIRHTIYTEYISEWLLASFLAVLQDSHMLIIPTETSMSWCIREVNYCRFRPDGVLLSPTVLFNLTKAI